MPGAVPRAREGAASEEEEDPMPEAMVVAEQSEWSPTACPSWCETGEHGPGELEHRTSCDVTCSPHPKEQPTVEAARSKLSKGNEQWFQQNQAMSVALID